jgi:hypothetical protein
VALNLGCVISEIGGNYYWVTRENKEMFRRTSGTFVTYAAVDGSGYVRVIERSLNGLIRVLRDVL